MIAYDNFNSTPTQNSTCLVEISIENENDNRVQLMYPRDLDQPIVVTLETTSQEQQNNSASGSGNSSSTQTRQLVTRLLASDLDSPYRISFSLEREYLVRNYPAVVSSSSSDLPTASLFDVDADTGTVTLNRQRESISSGLYVLVVELIDRHSDVDDETTSVQKSRVYVFVAVTSQQQEADEATTAGEIARLREILNGTKLNDAVESTNVVVSSNGDDYDDYSGSSSSEEEEDQTKSVDYRLERVINQFKVNFL